MQKQAAPVDEDHRGDREGAAVVAAARAVCRRRRFAGAARRDVGAARPRGHRRRAREGRWSVPRNAHASLVRMGNPMTQESYAALEKEIEHLETEERMKLAGQIKTAREFGDLKENAEYHAAKEAAAHLESKIRRLKDQLAGATIVEKQDDDVVGFGSRRRGRGCRQRQDDVVHARRRSTRRQPSDGKLSSRLADRRRPRWACRSATRPSSRLLAASAASRFSRFRDVLAGSVGSPPMSPSSTSYKKRRRAPMVEAPLEKRAGESLVWTDGACRGNPGPGGWAAIVVPADRGRLARRALRRAAVHHQQPHGVHGRARRAALAAGRFVHLHRHRLEAHARVHDQVDPRVEEARLEDRRW